ncbi:hypothetical protein WN55_02667 [Dufourea novaeangliae]|uniref:Uncharacterized protein n=1 Tax=Dufourea novaeangliae TaxID=178035 RepID=A0A154NXB0_DUFNO|nr:hypothetical protein WN55_02667 [Dufourea novaeangliae]
MSSVKIVEATAYPRDLEAEQISTSLPMENENCGDTTEKPVEVVKIGGPVARSIDTRRFYVGFEKKKTSRELVGADAILCDVVETKDDQTESPTEVETTLMTLMARQRVNTIEITHQPPERRMKNSTPRESGPSTGSRITTNQQLALHALQFSRSIIPPPRFVVPQNAPLIILATGDYRRRVPVERYKKKKEEVEEGEEQRGLYVTN